MYEIKTIYPIYRTITEFKSDICNSMWNNTILEVRDVDGFGNVYHIPMTNIRAFRKIGDR